MEDLTVHEKMSINRVTDRRENPSVAHASAHVTPKSSRPECDINANEDRCAFDAIGIRIWTKHTFLL